MCSMHRKLYISVTQRFVSKEKMRPLTLVLTRWSSFGVCVEENNWIFRIGDTQCNTLYIQTWSTFSRNLHNSGREMNRRIGLNNLGKWTKSKLKWMQNIKLLESEKYFCVSRADQHQHATLPRGQCVCINVFTGN